jgi:uncharacterized protein (TIGR03067 family)
MRGALFLVALVIAQPAKDDAAQAELKRWEGVWTVESISYLGEKQPADKLKGEALTVKDGKYEATKLVKLMGFSKSGTLVLDPTKKPATLTRRVDVKDPGVGFAEMYNAIYRLDDDKLTVCFSIGIDGAQRPTNFEVTDKVTVMVFRRSKPGK